VLPQAAAVAGAGGLDLSPWSVLPFALLLLSIALLPLIAPVWWHENHNRAIVAASFAVPVAVYLGYVQLATGQPALAPLLHESWHYLTFVALLGSLYIVSGGIRLRGRLGGTPLANAAFLALGATLANVIGTTGASMLLVRPFLRANAGRRRAAHLPVFFIFTVSNVGGLLTPLGDPPLFLGFLNGVPFLWTLSLWREWLFVNASVLAVFLAWDLRARRLDEAGAPPGESPPLEPVRMEGLANVPLLAGVLAGVLIQGWIEGFRGQAIGAAIMVVVSILSMLVTPRGLRKANGFTWGPIAEVAILFAGIFASMVPALELLGGHGKELGLSRPWQFFWLTGILSGFLDNAPTYLTFATVAAGSSDFGLLADDRISGLDGPAVLRAISCGAVFLGALTYIGNGPNFMVKAIAEEAGVRMPSFFGYMAYSCGILIPLFLAVTYLFMR
jgi:Na+/H+ antiporter NhaD/arsenite permease-like protein